MNRLGWAVLATSGLVMAACGGEDALPPDAAPGPDTTVALFAGTQVYFTPENHRVVDAEVDLPAPELRYQKIILHVALSCPAAGGCDWWDRFGRISLVRDAGSDHETEIELARFVTPYRLGMGMDLDVSGLRPVLGGHVTARVFIDTWVGPGHANGAGWMVDASLEYTGGEPELAPIAVVPLWSPQGVVYGDPAHDAALATDVIVPEGSNSVRYIGFVTGHGQGNAGNCAEFCPQDHTLVLGDQSFTKTIWRDDCETTAVPNQAGTWQYPRAGWCPGAMVKPWKQELYPLTGGQTLHVGWSAASYENTCRPGVDACAGCTLGSACEYDGGNHTEPNFQVSGLLVFY